MQIQIDNHFTEDGREYIRFELWDGPDNIEHVQGFAVDLVQAFAKLLEWRERIADDYYQETLQDLDTLETFLNENETD